jgi:hypothetical protein
MDQHAGAGIATYIVPLLILALVIYRVGRTRTVGLRRMWIRPTIILGLTLVSLVASPPTSLMAIAIFAGLLIVGAGIGYMLAHQQALSIHPETGVISSTTTQVGTILVVCLFAFRYGIRLVFPEMAAHPGHATAEALAWTNGALIFACALILTQAVMLWQRTRPLLAEHAERTASSKPQQ